MLPQAQALLRNVRDLRTIASETNLAGESDPRRRLERADRHSAADPRHSCHNYPQMKLFIDPGSSNDLYRKVVEGDSMPPWSSSRSFPCPRPATG